SAELTRYQYRALGLNPIKEGDLFPLFLSAWILSFKEETIKKSFIARDIRPIDAIQILKKFTHTLHKSNIDRGSPSRLSSSDPRGLKRLARAAVKNIHQEESKKFTLSLHQLSVHNQKLRN
ncbi:hypothetical protein GcC1_124001, partial [Golovinomyces cichoracearum]